MKKTKHIYNISTNDKKRIDKLLNNITNSEKKELFLRNTIQTYSRMSTKLIPVKQRNHYTEIQKYCETLLKGIQSWRIFIIGLRNIYLLETNEKYVESGVSVRMLLIGGYD